MARRWRRARPRARAAQPARFSFKWGSLRRITSRNSLALRCRVLAHGRRARFCFPQPAQHDIESAAPLAATENETMKGEILEGEILDKDFDNEKTCPADLFLRNRCGDRQSLKSRRADEGLGGGALHIVADASTGADHRTTDFVSVDRRIAVGLRRVHSLGGHPWPRRNERPLRAAKQSASSGRRRRRKQERGHPKRSRKSPGIGGRISEAVRSGRRHRSRHRKPAPADGETDAPRRRLKDGGRSATFAVRAGKQRRRHRQAQHRIRGPAMLVSPAKVRRKQNVF